MAAILSRGDELTYGGWDKMAHILQTFLNSFACVKIVAHRVTVGLALSKIKYYILNSFKGETSHIILLQLFKI